MTRKPSPPLILRIASRLLACLLVATLASPTVFAAKRKGRAARTAHLLIHGAQLRKAKKLLRRGTAALTHHGPDVLAAIATARVHYEAAVETAPKKGPCGTRARRLGRKARLRAEALSLLEDGLVLLLALKPVDGEPDQTNPDPGYSMRQAVEPEVTQAMAAGLSSPGQDPQTQVLCTHDLANLQALSVRTLGKALRKASRAGIQSQVLALVRTDLTVQGLRLPLERHLQRELSRISQVFQLTADPNAQVGPSVRALVNNDRAAMETITRYQLIFRLQDIETLCAAQLVGGDLVDQLHNTVQLRQNLDN